MTPQFKIKPGRVETHRTTKGASHTRVLEQNVEFPAAIATLNRIRNQRLMTKPIHWLRHGVPAALTELRTLGRTLTTRAADVLAYFDRPGTSNGPTEAVNRATNTCATPSSASAT
jgi:transposase